MDIRVTLRRAITQIRTVWLVVGVTTLLLLAIEGTFALLFYFKTSAVFGAFDRRIKADTYEDASWVPEYYEEEERSRPVRWEPYVYWRRKPFDGTHINIDAHGIRQTVNPAARPDQTDPPRTIFMFGGSTLWGSGARDRFTIPSILAAELEKSDRGPVLVVNYGEMGYVSTQSVIALLLQFQKGHVPDMVIFYDGINDTFSAYQQGVAGLPQNEAKRVREFAPSAGTAGLLRNAFINLSVFRFANGLARRRGGGFSSDPIADPRFVPEGHVDAAALATDVVATYHSNVAIVRALGRHYGFKSLFYWQPVVFEKPHLTEYEQAQQKSRRHLQRFFQQTYDAMRRSGATGRTEVHDISTIFAATKEPVYVDWSHLGESGNAIVARRMARDVLALIDATE